MLLNYIDRGNLATAAPLLQEELSLSATQMGLWRGSVDGTGTFSAAFAVASGPGTPASAQAGA